MASTHHQVDGNGFRSVLPEDIDWKPFPPFPATARLAVVVGEPTEPGPYVIRVKLPAGVKLMPHKHPEDRVYTVISGVFYVGSATSSTLRSFRRIRPAPLSSSRAARITFTGRGPVSTSPRYRQSGRLAWNTSTRQMIRETAEPVLEASETITRRCRACRDPGRNTGLAPGRPGRGGERAAGIRPLRDKFGKDRLIHLAPRPQRSGPGTGPVLERRGGRRPECRSQIEHHVVAWL
jgi:hypothetical protein